jgi:alpha,alpha-trehalase
MADDSTYYPDVIRWLLAHPDQHPEYLVTDAKASCNPALSKVCAQAVVDGHRLSAAYFESDRAMRESGFDTSFRFGPFSGSTANYAPVCLNSLLFKYERDMAHFATLLDRKAEAAQWSKRAEARRAAIDKYLWDAKAGLYFDYDFTTNTRSTYHFLSTFYPLWSGAASPAQAAAVESRLSFFEQPGGLQLSDVRSGVQWDAPFGWAPTTWLAVAGLDRNGFHDDATRIARKFDATVLENFVRDGTIREKYNVASGSANVEVAAGYKSNVVGFGWTNGVYLKLQDILAK